MKKILLLIVLFSANLFCQNPDPNKLIEGVKDNFKSSVKDYEVTANIKVDVDFVKVPEMQAHIYFKQPDKVKMNTEGFAMLPKQAFNFSPEKLFTRNSSAIYVRTEKWNNTPIDVIRVIPNEDNSDIALSTFWIEPGRKVIRKIESTPKRGGAFQAELYYDEKTNYPLPTMIRFSFDSPRFNAPRETSSNDKPKDGSSKPSKGTVTVKYSDYRINKGISDAVFTEGKKK